MKKVLIIAVAFLAVSILNAKSYDVKLFHPATVSGAELAAGDYKLRIADDKAVLTNGKQTIEASVRVEESETKFSSTSVRLSTADGKNRISEIRLGGARMRVVMN